MLWRRKLSCDCLPAALTSFDALHAGNASSAEDDRNMTSFAHSSNTPPYVLRCVPPVFRLCSVCLALCIFESSVGNTLCSVVFRVCSVGVPSDSCVSCRKLRPGSQDRKLEGRRNPSSGRNGFWSLSQRTRFERFVPDPCARPNPQVQLLQSADF